MESDVLTGCAARGRPSVRRVGGSTAPLAPHEEPRRCHDDPIAPTRTVIAANLTCLAHDRPLWGSFGELVTAGIRLAVLIRTLRVFPFDLGQSTFDWALTFSIVLVVAIAGTVLGLTVQAREPIDGGAWFRH
jgi:hypothetical protein